MPYVTPPLHLNYTTVTILPFFLHSLPVISLSPHHSAIARARQGVIADAMADTLTIAPRPRPFSKPSGPSPPKSSSSSSSGQPSPEQQRVTITLKDPKPFPSKVASVWNVPYQNKLKVFLEEWRRLGVYFFCGPSKLILDSVPVVSKSRMF